MKQLDYPKQYSISYLMSYTTNQLKDIGIKQPNLDARVLMMSAANMPFEDIIKYGDKDLSENQVDILVDYINKRAMSCPVSKIVGMKYFWEDRFIVSQDVLDPRPDSEILIEQALKLYNNCRDAKLNIIDLGTGSGCLIITLLKLFPNAIGCAIDISEKALEIARKNAERLGVIDRIIFKKNNWLDGINKQFDLIISNPPYIETSIIETLEPEVKLFDPDLALDGGKDGLDCYKEISKLLDNIAHDQSNLLFEIGQGQERSVLEIVEKTSKFKLSDVISDLSDKNRILAFKYFNG